MTILFSSDPAGSSNRCDPIQVNQWKRQPLY